MPWPSLETIALLEDEGGQCSMAGVASVGVQQEYAIGGVTVKFPCKPYRTQMAMMSKIITALNKHENALLESPTGSGKSLALLCSALAWLKHEHGVLQEPMQSPQEMKAEVAECCPCDCHMKTASGITLPPVAGLPTKPSPTLCVAGPSSMEGSIVEAKNVAAQSNGVVNISDPPDTTLQMEEAGTEASMSVVGKGRTIGLSEGGGGTDGLIEGGEKASELDDSLDEDFKRTKKRFRTPSAARPTAKRKKTKGVVYEDSDVEEEGGPPLPSGENGQAVWRMELKGGAGLGIPHSQIMDSGRGLTFDVRAGEDCGCGQSVANPCAKCGCSGSQAMAMKTAKGPEMKRGPGAPKIYFGTRTHKQITQITHEMGRTAYSDTPMCILASRKHTCVHPTVSTSKNMNDECRKLVKYVEGVSCHFYHRVQQKLGTQAQLRQYGCTTAWDIEDLVHLGNKHKACPYYAIRSLKEEADIIFCPYNYLIDPLIREQMLIDIENQVIILDEAHNMEDSARDAASVSVTSHQISDVIEEIEDILPKLKDLIRGEEDDDKRRKLCQLLTSYENVQAICLSMSRWIENTSQTLPPRGFEQACGIWNGEDFLPQLQEMGITPGTVETIKLHISNLSTSDEVSLSMGSLHVIKSIFIVVGYLFKNNMQYLNDYRISLMKTSIMRTKDNTAPGGYKRRRPRVAEKVWTFTLNFWCLNPAVAFSDLTHARSIVLTSGTLSPMNSFSSELGAAFSIQLEANHIIPESQTWVYSLSHGPHGRSLMANYQNSETFEFQDEIGELVLKVCQIVPYGVLCFMSSYKMLEKLSRRWQDTGLWYKIGEKKSIISEPRGGGKADFESAILSFYDVIRDSHSLPDAADSEGQVNGALFLAVCRGKASEGLDFADDNARAVITVGIPFPNIKDKQVELKREYNNEHSHSRGLLTGSEWYEIQAYRALNQALGRCIRHKKDWGALILVDERFGKGMRYTKGLSKWVRQRIKHQSDFDEAMSSLQVFAEARMKTDISEQSNSLFEKTLKTSLSGSVLNPATTPGPTSPFTGSSVVPITSTPITCGRARHLPRTILPIGLPSKQGAPAHSYVIPGMQLTVQQTSAIGQHKASFLATAATISPQSLDRSNQGPSASLAMASVSKPSLNLVSSTHSHPSFVYPGGVHLANPQPSNSNLLSDITNLDKLTSIKKAEPDNSMQVDNPVEETSHLPLESNTPGVDIPPEKQKAQNGCLDTEVVKSKPSTFPLSPSHSPCIQSPLLFDSCDSSSETPGQNQPSLASKLALRFQCYVNQQASTSDIHSSKDQTIPDGGEPKSVSLCIGGGGKLKLPDDDVTPPISPQKQIDINHHNPAFSDDKTPKQEKATIPLQVLTETTPVPKRNVRQARRRGLAHGGLESTSSAAMPIEDDDDDESDFKVKTSKTPYKTPRAMKPPENMPQVDVIRFWCLCGNALSKKPVASESFELKEALLKGFANYKVHTIQTSKLWSHMKGKSRKKVIQACLVAASDISCPVKEGTDGYNAMWDEKLGLCYALLQCKCGVTIGCKIYSASGFQNFVGKVVIPTERIQTSPST